MASEPQPSLAAVLRWRRELHDDTGASRASRARLRRATSVFDALLLEDTLDLIRKARNAEPKSRARDFDQRIVVLAMTLAHLEGESKTRFARALGQTPSGGAPAGDERPRLSPARFGALLRAARGRDWDGFARAMRRVLAILGDTRVDVAGLVADVLFLNDATLRRWAYEYWQTEAPNADEPPQSDSNEMETAP